MLTIFKTIRKFADGRKEIDGKEIKIQDSEILEEYRKQDLFQSECESIRYWYYEE